MVFHQVRKRERERERERDSDSEFTRKNNSVITDIGHLAISRDRAAREAARLAMYLVAEDVMDLLWQSGRTSGQVGQEDADADADQRPSGGKEDTIVDRTKLQRQEHVHDKQFHERGYRPTCTDTWARLISCCFIIANRGASPLTSNYSASP